MKAYRMFEIVNKRAVVCGHRGASAVAPENTIEAFSAARDLGATWLEFDVRPTKDGQLVVHHDPDTAQGHHIAGTKAAELPEFIPTLTDVMNQFGDLGLDVELKTDDTNLSSGDYAALASEEIKRLHAAHSSTDILITSFDADVLEHVAAACPGIATGFLYYSATAMLSEKKRAAANEKALAHACHVGHQAVVPHHQLVTEHMVEAAHQQGLGVATWTVNTAADTIRCARAGVDLIIGDDPRVITAALDSLGELD